MISSFNFDIFLWSFSCIFEYFDTLAIVMRGMVISIFGISSMMSVPLSLRNLW